MSSSTGQEALLARQPIYNRNLDIRGYELLFRGATPFDTNDQFDGDSATSRVLLNAFGEVGLEDICGPHPALINFTRNLILNLPPFDPKRYVIEILEDIQPDATLISALEDAKKAGAKLALDDFVLNHNSAPLLHLVDMIKVDVLQLSKDQIKRYADVFVPRKILLLAEKVESHDMYEYCASLGYHYFQGYFLSRPQIIEGKAVADNKLVVAKLLQELNNLEVEIPQLSKTLSLDPQLSYKLLSLVNSAAFARVNKCTSLQQALASLGLNNIRRWANLIALGKTNLKPSGTPA